MQGRDADRMWIVEKGRVIVLRFADPNTPIHVQTALETLSAVRRQQLSKFTLGGAGQLLSHLAHHVRP